MRQELKKAMVSTSEAEILENSAVFYEEVASNLYFIRKHRFKGRHEISTHVDGTAVASDLNESIKRGWNVAIKKMDGEIVTNYQREMYREFYTNTLNREL